MLDGSRMSRTRIFVILPAMGMDFYALSLIFLTISTTGGATNFIVTILASARARHGDQPDAAVSLQHAYHFLRHLVRTACPDGRLCLP